MKNIYETLSGAKVLKEKIAVVSGGGSGIGTSIVRLFANQGAKTIIVDLNFVAAKEIAEGIEKDGGRATAFRADITKENDIKELFLFIKNKFGKLDILVNNAGGGLPTKLYDISHDEWDRIINLNLTATFLISQAASQLMSINGGGAIVNLSSQAGRSTSPTAGCHYTASKAGVLGMTRHMARELAKSSVRVNAVCPGVINTSRIAARIEAQKTMEQICCSIPMGRIGEVDEIAACCLFLASDLSSFVTGAVIDANGGALMM
jgi:NAD(P)-dependent dehydrogenase (short-subunit alcohol dehydrogenase family)